MKARNPSGWRGKARAANGRVPSVAKAGQVPARRCTAHSSRTGKRCTKAPIKGGNVCTTHGGSAPQVQHAAKLRLAALVDPAIDTLHYAVKQRRDQPAVALSAAKDILDRNNLGAAQKFQHQILMVQPEDLEKFTTEELGLITQAADLLFERVGSSGKGA